jgi:hypothetical protein
LIALSFEDFAGQDSMLDIENSQQVLIHFTSRMLGDDVATISDSVSNSDEHSPAHTRRFGAYDANVRERFQMNRLELVADLSEEKSEEIASLEIAE